MLLGVTNTKYAFRQHLSRIGFLMDQPPQAVAQEFARHMGPQRYAQYQQIGAAAHKGEDQQNCIYDFMQDLREANLLRCLSPDVTQDTSYYLYEKSLPHLKSGKRVIELACWTGGLVSFIAENHPDCTVVGVDRARRIVELNRLHYRLPNLDFMLWDYRQGKPNDLEPADLLLCGLGTNNDCPPGAYTTLNPLVVRKSDGYQREKYEAIRYFRNWRRAAKNGAILLTVLRVFTFPRFLAFMDAAQEADWTPLFEQFAFVPCPSNKEAIPSLVFAARPSEPISEDMALSHWMKVCAGNPQLAQFAGPAALGMYRSLGEKRVLAHRDGCNPQGFTTREELGVCGAFGYIYAQDARPDHRLVLMSIAQAESQSHSFTQTAVAGQSGVYVGNNVVLVM
ncbi:MAG: class I SAM-dependent methyltransferase [Pirellulales bacterium]